MPVIFSLWNFLRCGSTSLLPRNWVPLAKDINVDFVWVHANATVLESTLAYSLNQAGTPTLVVEMGVGMRITKAYGYQLVEGLLNVMKTLGIWDGEVGEIRKPIVSADQEIGYLNADCAGIYVPQVQDRRTGERRRSSGRNPQSPYRRRGAGGESTCFRYGVYKKRVSGSLQRFPAGKDTGRWKSMRKTEIYTLGSPYRKI